MQGDKAAPVDPANMLWLIQRDFLEGKTVQAMVKEALAPQDNALNDPDIAQVSSCGAPCQPDGCRSMPQPLLAGVSTLNSGSP